MRKNLQKNQTGQEIELRSQLARALADYDNLRKRVDRERSDFEKLANLKLVIRLLPVLEILRKAQKHLKDPGIELTLSEFEQALVSEGIEEIKVTLGDSFNPELHEAIDTVAGEGNKGKIMEVASSGWRFTQGPVIRHAQVRVTKGN